MPQQHKYLVETSSPQDRQRWTGYADCWETAAVIARLTHANRTQEELTSVSVEDWLRV